MKRFEGQVVLITGAAKGIGYATAKRFIAEGATVMMADLAGDALQAAAASLGSNAHYRRTDVSNKMDVEGLVSVCLDEFEHIDIVINNAGITHACDFLSLDEVDFDRVMRNNVKSMFLVGQASAREMIGQKRPGVIINVSSVNGRVAIAQQAAYVTSKGAVDQLTKVMALALISHGIRVNGVAPGTILTENQRANLLESPTALHRALSRTPMQRCGEPSEVAGVIAFLASEDASYMCGEVVLVDGGRLALNDTVEVTNETSISEDLTFDHASGPGR